MRGRNLNCFSPDAFWSRVADRSATSAVLLDVMIPWLAKAPPRPNDRRNTLNKVHMQPLPLDHASFANRFGITTSPRASARRKTGTV